MNAVLVKLSQQGAQDVLEALQDTGNPVLMNMYNAVQNGIKQADFSPETLAALRANALLEALHGLANDKRQWEKLAGNAAYIEALVPATHLYQRHFVRLWKDAYRETTVLIHPLERDALAQALALETAPKLVKHSEEGIERLNVGTNFESAMLEILKRCELVNT